ncbi:hypothetical protein Bpfe_029342, partial [Biomphalaria pfeifferi]
YQLTPWLKACICKEKRRDELNGDRDVSSRHQFAPCAIPGYRTRRMTRMTLGLWSHHDT